MQETVGFSGEMQAAAELAAVSPGSSCWAEQQRPSASRLPSSVAPSLDVCCSLRHLSQTCGWLLTLPVSSPLSLQGQACDHDKICRNVARSHLDLAGKHAETRSDH